MPQPLESSLQPPPNAGGQNVRLAQVTALINGVPSIVVMQIIGIADEFGNPLLWGDRDTFMKDLLDEIRAVRLGLEYTYNDGKQPSEQVDLLADAQDYAAALADATT